MFSRNVLSMKRLWHRGYFIKQNYFQRLYQSQVAPVNDVKILEDDALSVSEIHIEKELKEHDSLARKGFTCFEIDCKFCSPKTKSNVRKIYVNRTTGYYQCGYCNAQGPWNVFENAINYIKDKKKPLQDQELKNLNFKSSSSPTENFVSENKVLSLAKLPSDEIQDLLTKFKLPHINAAALSQLDACIDESKSTLLFPLKTTQERTGYKIVEIVSGEESTVPPNSGSGVIVFQPEEVTYKGKNQSKSAIVVTSIADVFALIDSKLVGSHIICLPRGITHLPQEVLPSLEAYQKLILWFGKANGAWEVAHVFAKKLNEKRCYLVRPTDEGSSPRDAAEAGKDLPAIVAEAKPAWVEAVTTFSTLREHVLFELQNIPKVEGVKWTRFPMLNELLRGHRRGELTILTGPTGAGKTTFLSEYTLDLAQKGVNTLWGSFEIPNHRLARTMLTQIAQLPIQEHMEHFDEFADMLDRLPIFFLKFHGQQSSKVVMKVVEHAAYVHDIAHVVIDTVQFMLGTSDESRGAFDRYWIQDLLISSFRSFATKANCHVTLVIHPRKEREGEDLHLNSVFGGAKATQEADNVLIMVDHRHSGQGVQLKVAKNRFCGILGHMPLHFNKSTLSFAPNKNSKENNMDGDINQLARKAGWRTV